ncbi:hypothetical protein PHYPSEUDO_012975 [Phytophthora pseudosyringae]|uniref:Uncharacterized protein n=1 Tax=Phytophthora pseudosyringae TaxID=221518 RepID=A0A8T1W7P5_9STRA|nr:hypothetical protein PHYPSEUDO_012975 [Phytophthora pseudosyringae]
MTTETSSVDKSDPVAVVAVVPEPAAPSVSAAMSAQKKPKKPKTKVKAAVAAVAAAQEISEAEHLSNLTVDHPYLSVLYKRLRSHRKKLEKIKGLELAQLNEGKMLNAQQLELMGNKSPLEKLVVELEMLREQFLGVYSQELEQKTQEGALQAEGEVVAAVKQVEEKEESEPVTEQEEPALEVQETVEDAVETVEQQTEEFANVFELLKTLHLVNLHQTLGKEVPMVLDFFSKVLLGNTRPPAELSYEENLMESLEEAKKYLARSDKVFACDTTYGGLRVFVDQLADISSGKSEKEEVDEAVDAAEEGEEDEVVEGPIEDVEEPAVVVEAPDVPVVPAEINTMPQISFFTESQLEPEHGDETAEMEQVEVIESQVEVAAEVQGESAEEIIESDEGQHEEQVEVPVGVPPAPESVPAPPLSFAAVAAGVTSERTPSPSASSGSSGNDKKEPGSGGNSPRKNSRRRGQVRWREKGSNSSSGNKSGNGSPTNGGKPRRPRTNDENSGAQGVKRSGSKEGRRPRIDRGLRKQGSSTQQHAAPMIAPHA